MSNLPSPENVRYAAQLGPTHDDAVRIERQLARIAELFEHYLETEHFVNVKQYGAWITREDRE